MIKKIKIRNIETYAFPNRQVFLDFIQNKYKILIAINAEKIFKDDKELIRIINDKRLSL